MLQITNLTKSITIVVAVFILFAGAIFFNTAFSSVARPFFFDKEQEVSNVSLDKSLDEAVDYLRQREDLTASTPSATLVEEAKKQVSAEIINGSGKVGAAKALADELEELGITVAQISNSAESAEQTIIGLKSTALVYKDDIVSKIGIRLGGIKFETPDNTYPFDIRIIIGR